MGLPWGIILEATSLSNTFSFITISLILISLYVIYLFMLYISLFVSVRDYILLGILNKDSIAIVLLLD